MVTKGIGINQVKGAEAEIIAISIFDYFSEYASEDSMVRAECFKSQNKAGK